MTRARLPTTIESAYTDAQRSGISNATRSLALCSSRLAAFPQGASDSTSLLGSSEEFTHPNISLRDRRVFDKERVKQEAHAYAHWNFDLFNTTSILSANVSTASHGTLVGPRAVREGEETKGFLR